MVVDETTTPVTTGPLPPDSWASSIAVRRSMRGNRSRDTLPELAIRSALHALGLRFRVDARPVVTVPRRADVVFRGARIAVFIDGCFWHGCPDHYRPPATNPAYWLDKVSINRLRDRDTDRRLLAIGWRTVRIWEHEPVQEAVDRIRAVHAASCR
jgi:DNA mismatch endonuclease (patch repair protein)